MDSPISEPLRFREKKERSGFTSTLRKKTGMGWNMVLKSEHTKKSFPKNIIMQYSKGLAQRFRIAARDVVGNRTGL